MLDPDEALQHFKLLEREALRQKALTRQIPVYVPEMTGMIRACPNCGVSYDKAWGSLCPNCSGAD